MRTGPHPCKGPGPASARPYLAVVVGLGSSALGGFTLISLLPLAAFVAAAIYLTDVRPKVREFRGGTSSGPYGPW